MKRNDFLDKVANDNRAYVQELLAENDRLAKLVARLQNEIETESRRFAERYVEVEQQNTNLANLYVASYQLNGTLDRERVISAIQEIVINLIGSEELAIWEADGDVLNLAGSFGIDRDEWATVPFGNGVVGLVASTGDRFVITDAFIQPSGREEHLTACIPLKLDEKVVGAIAIFRLLAQKEGLQSVDFEMFDLLGSHAASALFCTRLFEQSKETCR